jgi:hypothetical protein
MSEISRYNPQAARSEDVLPFYNHGHAQLANNALSQFDGFGHLVFTQ